MLKWLDSQQSPILTFASLSLEIAGKPVKLQLSTALGSLIPNSFKGMLDKIGIKPSKWF